MPDYIARGSVTPPSTLVDAMEQLADAVRLKGAA
jgi:hypothetical protein